MPRKDPLFAVGDNVLCFHGPCLYAAIVQKVEEDGEDSHRYHVHFRNWNSSYDEWVHGTRVLATTPENLEMQARLMAANGGVSKKAGGRKKEKAAGGAAGGAAGSGSSGSGEAKAGDKAAKRSKRGPAASASHEEDDTVEDEAEFASRPDVKLAMPEELKQRLVEDWDKVTKQQKLVKLPCLPTVNEIVDEYAALAASKPKIKHIVAEVAAGIKIYFQEGLPTVLLYKFERPQYDSLVSEAKIDPCGIYGLEHLLRLFVKLPALLAHTDLGQQATTALTACLHDLMKHLQKNLGKYATVYEETTPAYRKFVPT